MPLEGSEGLVQLTEKWREEYKLEINASKSQAMVFGVKSKLEVQVQGKILKHIPEYSYLWNSERYQTSGRKNLAERMKKMEPAWRSCMGLIGGLRG